MTREIRVIPVTGMPEVVPGDSLADLILDHVTVEGGDVIVVTSKIVSKSEGRLVDVALGCAGITAILDLRGTADAQGRPLEVTEVAVVDEVASAADLVMGKAEGVPVAIVRGVDRAWFREGSVRQEIVRPPGEDLFR